MQNDDTSLATSNEVSTTDYIPNCKKCGAPWEAEVEICPWCGADKSGTQILPFQFRFPKIDPKESKWNQKRAVPISKAIPILLLSIVFGAILYFLLPIVLTLSLLAKWVILVLVIYAAVSIGISYGISALFKLLINVWGKGNSTWLTVVTSIIIFVPSALINTIAFWSAGGVAGIMSLIFGLALPLLGFAGVAIFYVQIGSGKFCPYCDSNIYLRKDVLKIHSCNTAELLRRIGENEPKNALSDLNTPEISKHAFTSVDCCVCKKQGCRHAQLNVYQHMMHLTYDKQNNRWQENDVNQLIAEFEISDLTFESWAAGWDKKDKLA